MSQKRIRLSGLKYALLLLGSLALLGCDDKQASANPTQVNSVVTSQAAPPDESTPAKKARQYSQEELTSLAERFKDKPLTIIDVSEVKLAGANTIVMTFSAPVSPNQDFASFISVHDKNKGRIDAAWEIADNLMELRLRHMEPNRSLKINVDSGLKGVNGLAVTSFASYDINTDSIVPSVGFASRGSLLPSELIEGLPVLGLNVKSVDVDFFLIKQKSLSQFLTAWGKRSSLYTWSSNDFINLADLVYTGRFDLNTAPNVQEKVLLPIKGIKSLESNGVYLAVMRQAGEYQNYAIPATIFSISDIGVSVHQYNDQLDLFAQSLSSGESLANVTFTLLNENGEALAEAKSDKQGHAQLSEMTKQGLILATQDEQTSIIDLRKPALDLSEFAIVGEQGYEKTLFAFGPRDIYRPGETLIVNALLRDSDGKLLPDQPIKVNVLMPDGRVTRTFVWQGEKGFYQYQYPISSKAATGKWALSFDLGDNHPRNYNFQVEDFMPERIALSVKGSDEPLAMEESAQFAIQADYLYGAPASDNLMQGKLYLSSDREAVAALPGFNFGSLLEEGLPKELDQVEQQLDNQGHLALTVNNEWSSYRSPLTLTLQTSVLESGGRAVTRFAKQAIWPANQLPGIRALFSNEDTYDYTTSRYTSVPMVDEDSLAEFEVVFTDVKGNKLAADKLDVSLVKERRDYYWNWSDDGWTTGYHQKDIVMDRQQVSIKQDATAKVGFQVEWGVYRVEVTDPATGLSSHLRFWAGYSWQENSGTTDGAVRPDQVKMKLDKPAYKAGEKIKLHVQAPTAGKGYLLVESNDEPLWWQEIDVPEQGAEFEVPVDAKWGRHDLYLSTLIVRPGDKSQHALPKRAVGLLHIPLDRNDRKIALAIDAPKKVEPNQTVAIKVKAQGNTLAKGEVKVLLSAVDSGVLNITDFVTPDPFKAFFAAKRYGIDIYDVYGNLIEGVGKKANLRFGGDSDEMGASAGGKKPITFVQIVAQQLETVVLNEQGETTIELPLPDFNGELRLMAQVWSDEEFGSAETKMVVASPVIVELSTPRFLAGGDQSHLALELRNLSGQPQALELTLSSAGLLQLGQEKVTYSVTLNKDEKQVLPVNVEALNGFGEGSVTLDVAGVVSANGDSKTLQKVVKVGVRPAYPAKTLKEQIVLKPGASWLLPPSMTDGLTPESIEAQLYLSGRPPINIQEHIRELYAYPYGCLEQVTSGLYPSLYVTTQQLNQLGIKTESDDVRRTHIYEGIEKLLAMQTYTGGFGYWDNTGVENNWGSVYALDFLLRAKERGYNVPEEALNKGINRLKQYVQNRNEIETYFLDNKSDKLFAVQSYAALVLAGQQQASLSDLRKLYEYRDKSSLGLPRVQLGIALRLMGDESRGDDLIKSGLNNLERSNNFWADDYGTSLRDTAMALFLLKENRLLSNVQDSLVLKLSHLVNSRSYLSTQERNALFLATKDLINSKSSVWQAELQSIEPQEWKSDTDRYASLSANSLSQPNVLNNIGQTTLYPQLTVVGYSSEKPAAESNGLDISRSYYDTQGRPVSLHNVRTGDLYVVAITVTTTKNGKQVRDALVVDLLPAGLEIENQNMSDRASGFVASTPEMRDLLDKVYSTEIVYQEYRDDRYVASLVVSPYQKATLLYMVRAVTKGTYVVPSPMVESMYQPWIRATGYPSDNLVIK